MQAGNKTLWSEINKLINSLWNKEELHDQWKEFIIVEYHSYQVIKKLNSMV
jgi:hypothetical protein